MRQRWENRDICDSNHSQPADLHVLSAADGTLHTRRCGPLGSACMPAVTALHLGTRRAAWTCRPDVFGAFSSWLRSNSRRVSDSFGRVCVTSEHQQVAGAGLVKPLLSADKQLLISLSVTSSCFLPCHWFTLHVVPSCGLYLHAFQEGLSCRLRWTLHIMGLVLSRNKDVAPCFLYEWDSSCSWAYLSTLISQRIHPVMSGVCRKWTLKALKQHYLFLVIHYSSGLSTAWQWTQPGWCHLNLFVLQMFSHWDARTFPPAFVGLWFSFWCILQMCKRLACCNPNSLLALKSKPSWRSEWQAKASVMSEMFKDGVFD